MSNAWWSLGVFSRTIISGNLRIKKQTWMDVRLNVDFHSRSRLGDLISERQTLPHRWALPFRASWWIAAAADQISACVNGTVLFCRRVKSVSKLILSVISLSFCVPSHLSSSRSLLLYPSSFTSSLTKKSKQRQGKTKREKTKGKKEEHVITGFVSAAAQYPDHPHQVIERDCVHAGW